jgi:hypothetical protein
METPGSRRILPRLSHRHGVTVYFYELREGDDDIFSDLLLVRDEEMAPADFFDLVQSIRRQIKDTFEDDTLIEAIAAVLQHDHDFTFVSDDQLTASVNVSAVDEDTFLVDPNDPTKGADYRGILVDRDSGAPYEH